MHKQKSSPLGRGLSVALALCLGLFGGKNALTGEWFIVISIGIWLSLLYAFHEWALKSGTVAERIGRSIVLMIVISGLCAWYGFSFWPRLTIKPELADFPAQSASHLFTLRNGTNEDAYLVTVVFAYKVPPTEINIIPPKPNNIGSSPVGDIMGVTTNFGDTNCGTFQVRQLLTGEVLKFQVESKTSQPFSVRVSITHHSSYEQTVFSNPSGAAMPAPIGEDCR